jgi:hypothetical protein
MRHIDLEQFRRFAKRVDTEALEAAKTMLSDMTSDADRRKHIDDKSAVCSAFLYVLWLIGFGKCWYSEAILEADAGEVEHFRPKKQVWKSAIPHRGYWWRAFDWRNFRLAHPLVNKRRKDYSTEQAAGKGCYFPLEDENRRAIDEAGELGEEPVLLDPTKARDCRLISYDGSSGKPIPRFREDEDPWKHKRAKESINYYHLDEGTWNAKRDDLMREVSILCDRVLAAAANEDWETYEQLLDEVASFVHPFAEFSSAAAQVITEKSLGFHLNPAPNLQQPMHFPGQPTG